MKTLNPAYRVADLATFDGLEHPLVGSKQPRGQ
jgi:hypothetical protein